ncbi:MAG: SMC-Scp complex subunit ScpB [Candidatus Omnitrophica bacterium]|nr:SMC-Scp complex subunit ScpB [Candidatus Omnitrophota bacterium]
MPLKPLVEALLFVSGSPVTVEQLVKTLEGVSGHQVREAVAQLSVEYEASERGIKILEVAQGYQMVTRRELAPWIKRFLQQAPMRLSRQCLETLAIIAYRQPVTRLEIEQVRGVSADGAIQTLLEKGMIRITGRKEALGRPFLYGTTPVFLERFGLVSLQDLPKLEEFVKKEEPVKTDETVSVTQTN